MLEEVDYCSGGLIFQGMKHTITLVISLLQMMKVEVKKIKDVEVLQPSQNSNSNSENVME